MCCICIPQIEMEFRLVVLPTEPDVATFAPASLLTKYGLKEIRETFFIKITGEVLLPLRGPATLGLPGVLKLFSMLPVFSILIIFLSFFRITQYFIRFVDLLKFFIRLLIVGIKIRMIFSCQFPVCF